MKRFQKRELLHIIELLQKLHLSIKKNIDQRNADMAYELLLECQQSAIDMGNAIEKIGEQVAATADVTVPDPEMTAKSVPLDAVTALEDYCEEIYQAAVKLQKVMEEDSSISPPEIASEDRQAYLSKLIEKNNNIYTEKTQSEAIYTELDQSLQKVRTIIEAMDCGKLEVVFFPYKASMWDSLESIWEAAAADERVEAYVVPIPYFEKNPDGTFGEMYDESGLYPDYVPVYPWESYEVQERRPDLIFIHNPYDNANHVTSVHPAFYSSLLHQYTDMLVYVPYFTVMDDVSENFCVLPGVVFADRVIVQSDQIRDSYIRHFEKCISNITGGKKVPQQLSNLENKFLALGSPKFDRVNRTKRDDSSLPEAWRKKIYAPDGSRKKVILYNTSISALLVEAEDMLEKIKWVFEVFRRNRNVVLWWRPHPLYESTLVSMRPHLLEEYHTLVWKYQSEDFGIYDDTPDIDQAIAQSDAYYGDRSSLVTLYENIGKPALIQNVLIQNAKDMRIPVWPSAFCVDGDDVWFVHGKINVLFRYNMQEKRTEIIGTVLGEKLFQTCIYTAIYKYGSRVFLIPGFAQKIAVYDIEQDKFAEIKLENREKYCGKILFCKAFSYRNYLYCIPHYYEMIIRINMDAMLVEYIFNWKKDLEDKNNSYIGDAAQISDMEFAGVVSNMSIVFIYNMNTQTIRIFDIGNSQYHFSTITGIGKILYLYDSMEHKIIMYSIKNNAEIGKIQNNSFKRIRLSMAGGNILADEVYEESMILMNIEGTVQFEETKKRSENISGFSYDYCYGICQTDSLAEQTFYYFDRNENKMFYFKRGIADRSFKFEISTEKLTQFLLKSGEIPLNNYENELVSLTDWTDKIIAIETECYGHKNGSNGKKIFQSIMEIVSRPEF